MRQLTHSERAALVESVRDLAWQFVWRIVVPRLGRGEAEDALQECLAAAWECSGRFDPARGCKFVTYAHHRMFWAANEYVRNHSRGPGTVRPDEDAPDPPARPDGRVEAADEAEHLRRVLGRLPARWRRLMELRFGLGTGNALTHKQVGERMGFSKGRSMELEYRVLLRLRKLMGAAA